MPRSLEYSEHNRGRWLSSKDKAVAINNTRQSISHDGRVYTTFSFWMSVECKLFVVVPFSFSRRSFRNEAGGVYEDGPTETFYVKLTKRYSHQCTARGGDTGAMFQACKSNYHSVPSSETQHPLGKSSRSYSDSLKRHADTAFDDLASRNYLVVKKGLIMLIISTVSNNITRCRGIRF